MPFSKQHSTGSLFIGLVSGLFLAGCASTGENAGIGLEDMAPIQVPSAKIHSLEVTTPVDKNPMYQMMVAELAVNSGDTELAVKNYLTLAESQNDPKIAERAVRIAVYAQDMDAAEKAAQRWIELQPDRTEPKQIIAAIFIRNDNPDMAFKYMEEVIKAQPSINEQTFMPLLGLLAREKNTATVLKVAKKIADKYPNYAYSQYLYGHLAAQANKPKLALPYLDRALAIKQIPDAHALRAKMLLKLGKRKEALFSLKRAVLSKPKNQQLRLALARLLVDMKEYEQARLEFEKLHQMAPNDPGLLYTLGLLALESQRFDAAEKYLTKLLESGKRNDEARYYLGRISQSRGHYKKAIEWYSQVKSGTYRFDAQLRQVSLIAKQGDADKALAILKKMTDNSPTKTALVRIYLMQGDILEQQGKPEKAIEVYNEALQMVPGNIDLLYARGLTGESTGNVKLLEDDMHTILKTEPDNAAALNALGFTLADQTDRVEEAFGYLQRAIQLNPDDPAIIDSFGWVNYRLGNYDKAIRLLKKALSQIEDGEIAAHLGEVLWVSGRQQEAMDIWQRALKKSPGDKNILKTMKRLKH
jgi:tetratricopeptide (TPR) repeat protein